MTNSKCPSYLKTVTIYLWISLTTLLLRSPRRNFRRVSWFSLKPRTSRAPHFLGWRARPPSWRLSPMRSSVHEPTSSQRPLSSFSHVSRTRISSANKLKRKFRPQAGSYAVSRETSASSLTESSFSSARWRKSLWRAKGTKKSMMRFTRSWWACKPSSSKSARNAARNAWRASNTRSHWNRFRSSSSRKRTSTHKRSAVRPSKTISKSSRTRICWLKIIKSRCSFCIDRSIVLPKRSMTTNASLTLCQVCFPTEF